MKRVIPVFAVLLLGGCTAASPQYVAQKQADVLANAETTCSQVGTTPKNIACLNWAVHRSGYWGQGVKVVAAKDGSPRLVDNYRLPDIQYNVGGDIPGPR
ncbi:MAG TPA: hypothetical protein VH189_13165 [Rhizomicrobium sp.]|jgi:ABC-type Fe3+-hydroxamate transport system substrate-binding protein|nr:hypothetical protein [Rhizomicrobium sp.]